jgi:hypothetical protein
MIDVAKLRAAACEIAREADLHQDALNDERTAEAAVLEAAIAAIKPALPALSSRITRASQHDDEIYFDERGLLLAQEEADALFLLDDGRLAVATDEAFVHPELLQRSDLRFVSTRESMDTFELDPCLLALEKAVEGQRGKRKAATEKSKRRAKQLREVAHQARAALDFDEGAAGADIDF